MAAADRSREDALAKEQRVRALVEARDAARRAEHDLRDAETVASRVRAEAEDARRRADEAARRSRQADAQVEAARQRSESAARHVSDLEGQRDGYA
jgi:chromosome segregation ATPase